MFCSLQFCFFLFFQSKSKKEYYQNDLSASSKTYWSIMKTFFSEWKVPAIPPLLFNGAFVTDFQEKESNFNYFFAKQCALVFNNSVLPSLTFSESDIIKKIRASDVNKAHDCDNISVRIIKFCANSIAHPLTLMFQNSLADGIFATHWKRANILPVNKKNDKQIVSNYRPVSLLSKCGKIFEELIFLGY